MGSNPLREELWQPELRRGGSSRSPRRRGSSTRSPIGGADAEELFTAGSGSSGGSQGGMVMGMPQQMMMRQMAMMNAGGNPMAQQAMMRQQLAMCQFQQQMMMGQMGAMQQMMMNQQEAMAANGGAGAMQQMMMRQQEAMAANGGAGAMQQMMMRQQEAMANAMRMQGTGNGGTGGTQMLVQSDPEETQRQMGRQAYANAVAAMNRRDPGNEDDDDVPSGPSSSVHHPNYRPPDAEPVPGLTDKRFEGRLKLWFEDKGYGFIECDDIKKKFPALFIPLQDKGYGFIECDGIKKKFPDVDVFLHQNQKRHFWKGAWISFGVFLNFRGKPQATELRLAKEPEEGNA